MPKNHSPSKSALATVQRPARESGPGKKPPVSYLAHSGKYDELPLQGLLDGLDIGVANVDRHGVPHLLRILPYRTVENRVDGAVITITTVYPKGEKAAQSS